MALYIIMFFFGLFRDIFHMQSSLFGKVAKFKYMYTCMRGTYDLEAGLNFACFIFCYDIGVQVVAILSKESGKG